MKALLLSICTIVILISCNDSTNPSSVEAKYYSEARLIADYPYVVSGDSVVFQRNYVAEDEEMIADDEYSEDLFFSIPSNLDAFDFKDEELKRLQLDLKTYCFCAPSSGIEIVGGSLSGKLANNVWRVNANFDFYILYQVAEDSFATYGVENRTFSGNFKLKTIPDLN